MFAGSNEEGKIKLGRYRHFKGGEYNVIASAKHSETLEELVVYEALYDNMVSKFWVRPAKMFFDKVEHEGQLVDRFKFIGE